MQLITTTNDNDLVFSSDSTKEQWAEQHCRIILAKRMAGKWLKTSRDFGQKHYGLEFVAETEVQMELLLGDDTKDKEPSNNAPDKSKGIVTIEGITQSFKLWERKVSDDIDNWNEDRLGRALKLLEPMERKAGDIRRRMTLLGAKNVVL